MDDFLTAAEQALRRKARVCFREGSSPSGGRAEGTVGPGAGPAGVEDLLRDIGFRSPGRGLLERALVIEEAAAASPKAGRALLESASATPGLSAAAGELAWVLGSAGAAVEAGQAAARDQGLFQSALMGHQKVQGDLADVFSAVQALRVRTYRALRLVDAGQTGRGEQELERAAAEAAAVRGRALALAGALLGENRFAEMMPEKERSRP